MSNTPETEGLILEAIDIVCPVCGCDNFFADELGELTCE